MRMENCSEHQPVQGENPRIQTWSEKLPGKLDWLLSITESLLVLSIAILAFFFIGFVFYIFMDYGFKDAVAKLKDSWTVMILILVPLFFRPIRMFLMEVQEAFGIKRKERADAKIKRNPPNPRQTADPSSTEGD